MRSGEWAPALVAQDDEGGGMITGIGWAPSSCWNRASTRKSAARISMRPSIASRAIAVTAMPATSRSASSACFARQSELPPESTADLLRLDRHARSCSSAKRRCSKHQLPGAAIRGFGGISGHALEAQFTLGLAFAALAVDSKAKVPPFDAAHEKPMSSRHHRRPSSPRSATSAAKVSPFFPRKREE